MHAYKYNFDNFESLKFHRINSSKYMEILYDSGRRSFDDLHEDEIKTLTGFILKETNPLDQFDFIINSDCSNDIPHAVAEYLISFDTLPLEAKKEKLEYLIETLEKSTVSYANNLAKQGYENYILQRDSEVILGDI